MDFTPSPQAVEYQDRLLGFMDSHVYPTEISAMQEIEESGNPHHEPSVLEELKTEAKKQGLWNLFLPGEGHDLKIVDYAVLAEVMGRSMLAAEATNCGAPDTGNMEVLHMFGTEEQKGRWLEPLLAGEIRSCFSMTEPAVASSDATNIETSIVRDGDEYVINGHKWFISGAANPKCEISIVMGKTDTTAAAHQQQSMVLVPMDTPGVNIVRNMTVFGYDDREGHCDVIYDNVRVPAENLISDEGAGFLIAQARLGPGRIHHCMRSIGVAELALELMCQRALARRPFGKTVAHQGLIQDWIAEARIEIDQARLMTLYTAWLMDTVGAHGARTQVSAIKVIAPNMALKILDRAIQVHGAAGVSQDTPLARMYAGVRTLRIADGPCEVHKMTIARRELKQHDPDFRIRG